MGEDIGHFAGKGSVSMIAHSGSPSHWPSSITQRFTFMPEPVRPESDRPLSAHITSEDTVKYGWVGLVDRSRLDLRVG
jgi:hypothetical protein